MGNAGPVILFVSLYAALGIVGVVTLSYAAHCFYTVLQDTAAGIDEVKWPTESAGEWMGKLALLGWQVLVWLMPLGLFLRAAGGSHPGEFVVLAGVILWLFFPVGVLSSIGGGSRWAFLQPKLLAGLARIAPVALGFYAAVPLLLTFVLYWWYFALTREPLLIPVAAGFGAAGLLIYARLLGRVAWKLNTLEAPLPPRPEPEEDMGPRMPVSAHDPWSGPPRPKRKQPKAPPAAVTTEPGPDGADSDGPGAYGVAPAEQPTYPDWMSPKKKRKGPPGAITDRPDPPDEAAEPEAPRRRPIEEPGEPYALSNEPLAPRPIPPEAPEASALEMRLAERTPQHHVPDLVLLSGVLTFPWYDACQRPWLWLTLVGSLAGGIMRMMLSVAPG